MLDVLESVAFGFLTFASIAFLGCSASNVSPVSERTSCELNVGAVCARAMENYLAEHETWSIRAGPRKTSEVVPLVVPMKMLDGELAAEVDCYMSISADGPWLVDAHVAIQPRSQRAVEYLLDQEVCTNTLPERSLALRSIEPR
jgi:hypothetical protein